MIKLTVAVAAATALAGAAMAQQPAGWKTYSYPELGFAIDLPAAPTVQKMSIPTAIGPAPTTMVLVDEGQKGALILAASDYTGLNQAGDDDQVLEACVKGETGSLGGATSDQKITVEGHAAREVTFQNTEKGIVARSRVVRIGMRLYQLIGVGVAGSDVPADFARAEQSLTFNVK
jgi:hypothetical protein